MVLKKLFNLKSQGSEISFLVKGSKPEPYTVTFKFDDKSFAAICTCPAGEEGMHCKHRVNFLNGDTSNVVNGNKEDIKLVLESYSRSELKTLLDSLILNGNEIERLKKESLTIKKKIAKYMS